MNPIIQANERLIKVNEFTEAHELHDFITQLDKKYGVDSSDPDNTFGKVPLNDYIIQYGVSNLCYFAKTDVEYWTKKSNYQPIKQYQRQIIVLELIRKEMYNFL